MIRIALDAGHGYNTRGKRTPDGEREWTFNDKVLRACWDRLMQFDGVQLKRLDDPTGKHDISLTARTNAANAWNANVLVSIHHNANAGKWGSHGGVETFVQANTASSTSKSIAKLVHSNIVKAMGLRDRGVKSANLHMTRESRMPAILTEGGFMDSTTDIFALRSDAKLKAQGIAIADSLAEYFKLKLKQPVKEVVATTVDDGRLARASKEHQAGQDFVIAAGISNGEYPAKPITREQVWTVLKRFDEYLNNKNK